MTEKELARLLSDAKKDKPLKEKLIATRSTDNPVEDFCALARSLGYEINAGELFALEAAQRQRRRRESHRGLGRRVRAIFYRADMDIIDTTA